MNYHRKLKVIENKSKALELIYKGMKKYLNGNAQGKKFHDPFAVAVAIDESVCDLKYEKILRNLYDF